MHRYILSRVLQGIVTLVIISLLVFVLARVSGDPLERMMPPGATPADFALVAEAMGLDKPMVVQYGIYASRVLQGDLGTSIRAQIPVQELIAQRLPNTIRLSLVSVVIAMLIAVPLGVVAAVRRGKGIDTVAKTVAILGQSVPAFWLGLVLILIFASHLGWLPASGTEGLLSYVMPCFTLGWFIAVGIMRLQRSSLLEALDSEYVKLARIKGLSEWRVIMVHAFPNALIPVITFSTMQFAMVIGNAVVVETVFLWPGIGRLAYEAILWRDYPVIQGVVLTVAVIVVIVNLVADLLYAFIDPRIRY